jgi:hypothetical protein
VPEVAVILKSLYQLDRRSSASMAATTDVIQPDEVFDVLYESRQEQFISSATLQRSSGGHGLAFPCWTMLPISYPAPVLRDLTRVTVERGFVDYGSHNCVVVRDENGSSWELDEVLQFFFRRSKNSKVFCAIAFQISSSSKIFSDTTTESARIPP